MDDTTLPGIAAAGHYMDTSPFWAGTREKKLLLQFCTRSGKYQFYPRPVSVHTGRLGLEWRQATGRGRLVAWTVDRMSAVAPGAAPRIHAFVDLDEGVRLLTWLVGCEPGTLRAGLRLKVHWMALEGAAQWPAFAPDPVSNEYAEEGSAFLQPFHPKETR